jgi:hypothetical protein
MFVGVEEGLPYPPNSKDKHSNLFCHINRDKEESLITLTSVVNFTNIYEQIFHQNPFAKKLQTQIVST